MDVCINRAGEMRDLYIFKIATQILTFKHPKLFSIYVLETNVSEFIRCRWADVSSTKTRLPWGGV